jgi:hypothetical protein
MLEVGAFEQRLLIAGNINKALHASFYTCLSLSAIWLDPSSPGEQARE